MRATTPSTAPIRTAHTHPGVGAGAATVIGIRATVAPSATAISQAPTPSAVRATSCGCPTGAAGTTTGAVAGPSPGRTAASVTSPGSASPRGSTTTGMRPPPSGGAVIVRASVRAPRESSMRWTPTGVDSWAEAIAGRAAR